MIDKKTVFILGAGASCPYGYPSGSKLRQEICSSFLSDSKNYFRAQEAREPEIQGALNKAKSFVNKFRDSSTQSIDLFLARNPEFMAMGKYAIIFRIFASEKNSKFREQSKIPDQDWYSHLFNKLTDDIVKKEDYAHFGEDNKISFITFNYDRSLEHFLYESLRNSFSGIPAGKIKEQLNKCRIIHVFGQVAGLDWQDFDSKIEYGYDVNRIDVNHLTNNLRIIYEDEQNPELEEARKLISDAKHIFLLGFGYAPENLSILGFPKILTRGKRAYGTALNLEPGEVENIRSFLSKSGGQHILPNELVIRQDCDCLKLLRNYL